MGLLTWASVGFTPAGPRLTATGGFWIGFPNWLGPLADSFL